MLGVSLSAAGASSFLGPGWVLVEGRNRRAASPLQGLLVSLGVKGHFAIVTASGQGWPKRQKHKKFGYGMKSGKI